MAAALTMVGAKGSGAWPSCGGAYADVTASGSSVLFHFESRGSLWSAIKQLHDTLMISESPCFAVQARSAVSPIPYSTFPQAMLWLRLFLEVTVLLDTRVTQLRGVVHAVRPAYLYPCIEATANRLDLCQLHIVWAFCSVAYHTSCICSNNMACEPQDAGAVRLCTKDAVQSKM
jgi:hypothetical protein